MIGRGKATAEQLPYDTEPLTDGGIDLVALVAAIVAEWKVALLTFLLVAAAGLAYVRTLVPLYVASATFLPSEGHAEAANIASILNASGPGNLYVGLMRSRSVQDDVVDRVHLLARYSLTSREIGRAILAGKTFISEGPDGIITIAIRDDDAQAAAKIANAYLLGLQDLSDKMAQAQSNQSRGFLEKQLDTQRSLLNAAEQNLLDLQERTGQVAPEAQASTAIGNIAGFRSQITGLEVQLGVLRQSEAEGNPDVQRLETQLAQLQAQERKQEAGSASTPIGAAVAAKNIPTLNLELSHAQEIVASRRAAVAAMAAQAGSARVDPQFSHPVFQIIDSAIPPETKAWPPPGQYRTAALGFAAIMSLVMVLVVLVLKRILRNPEHRATLRRLRRAF